MKPIYLTFAFLLAGLMLNAQDDEMRYIFSDKEYKISGFGAPVVQFSTFDGNFAVYNGGGGAVIFNNSFFIGGFGMGLSTEHRFPQIYKENAPHEPLDENFDIEFGYGGLWIGYIFKPNMPVHFGLSTKFGGGAITLYDNKFEYSDIDYHTDIIGVVSPQVELEMNLTRWFKINFGVGYQIVTGISDDEYVANADGGQEPYFEKDAFNAPYGNISFLFGGFGPKND